MTPSKWIKQMNAIGMTTKAGRYGGGTYAHSDIAKSFATWISPEFQLYIMKDYRRLIGVILNNALSNAIRAASGSKDPYVELKAWKNNNAYLIQVRNRFAGKLMLDPQTELPETSKDDKESHGYWLMNMKRITEKYYGTIQLEHREDAVFN